MLTDTENDEEDSGLSSTEGDIENLNLSLSIIDSPESPEIPLPHLKPPIIPLDSIDLASEDPKVGDPDKDEPKEGDSRGRFMPALQYFLTSLCEFKIPLEERKRLGLRYPKTPEVRRLILTLEKCRLAPMEFFQADANVIVSVLKELLSQFPGGIFNDENEEFICVSLQCSFKFALIYVKGLIETLPDFLKNFTYLVCKSLKNLAQQSLGAIVDAYTDLLILFTPVLFPHSTAEISRFLRATRISLILIDMCEVVFHPFLKDPSLDGHADEDFFKDIIQNLSNLQNSFSIIDEGHKASPNTSIEIGLEPELELPEVDLNPSQESRLLPKNALKPPENSMYYQITYVE